MKFVKRLKYSDFLFHFISRRTVKLPTPPALRRVQNARASGSSFERNTERTRKISVAKGPAVHVTKTTVSSSELPKIQQSSVMMQNTRNLERDTLDEPSAADRRSSSHSDFLRQVASRLENEVGNRDTTASSTSISPPDTPMLPTLSPSSSIASFMFSSDSSGAITPVRGHSSRLKVDNRSSRNDESSTPRRRNKGKIGSSKNVCNLMNNLSPRKTDSTCFAPKRLNLLPNVVKSYVV